MARMRAFGRWTVLSLLVISALAPSVAVAHSNSVESDPANGARIEVLPRVATVTFNEPVSEAALALTPPDGRVDTLRAQISGTVVSAPLPSVHDKGDYVLAYRVVSEDGHPVTGEVKFTVTTGADPVVVAPAESGTSSTSSAGWAFDISLAGVIGGALVLVVLAVLLVRAARR